RCSSLEASLSAQPSRAASAFAPSTTFPAQSTRQRRSRGTPAKCPQNHQRQAPPPPTDFAETWRSRPRPDPGPPPRENRLPSPAPSPGSGGRRTLRWSRPPRVVPRGPPRGGTRCLSGHACRNVCGRFSFTPGRRIVRASRPRGGRGAGLVFRPSFTGFFELILNLEVRFYRSQPRLGRGDLGFQSESSWCNLGPTLNDLDTTKVEPGRSRPCGWLLSGRRGARAFPGSSGTPTLETGSVDEIWCVADHLWLPDAGCLTISGLSGPFRCR
ncbi:hypothetical protein IscW_ISCW012061, partial [Ixodes scapularis]